MMTTERHAWASLHPMQAAAKSQFDTCPCGQELDRCSRRHCPRCGTSIILRVCA